MKTNRLIKASLLLTVALILAACTSEDMQKKGDINGRDTKYVATFTGNQPKAVSQAKSRTTATHTLGNPAQVLWEATDRIWVKASDGRFYQSEAANFAASATPTDHSRANFHLSQGYYATTTPEVRYVGTSTNADRVTIAAIQTQASPNDFSHLGTAGDCGTATAHSGDREAGDYEFTLQHKASYLCFAPRCMNTAIASNIKLTKIVVTANKPIAGTYDFSDGSLMSETPTGSSQTITLNVGGTQDFSMNTTTENLAKNGAYMVLAPGTYNLTITYTLLDNNNRNVDIVKNLNNFTCPEGQIKDIRADLTQNEEMPIYYMWDAQQHYWWGHEADQPFSQLQAQGQNWPQNDTDPRWYNNYYDLHVPINAGTALFRKCPNANELWWYAMKGDPHWDATGGGRYLTTDTHKSIVVGGLWLKKKDAIVAYLKAHEGYPATLTWDRMKEGYGGPGTYYAPIASPKDLRLTGSIAPRNPNVVQGRPSDTEIGNYFFLPAVGYYDEGKHYLEVCYWSSSGYTAGGSSAWILTLWSDGVRVNVLRRRCGVPARPFE